MRAFRYPRLWLRLWILMLALGLVVCLLPLPPVAVHVEHFDKFEHIAGHAVLAAFASMLFAGRRALLECGLGLVLFGTLIEALQALVPWRSADALDLLANAIGTLLGLALALTPLARALQWLDRQLPGR